MKLTLEEIRNKFGYNERREAQLEDLESLLADICNEFSGKRVLLYGSFITGEENPSDIDVMVSLEAMPPDAACGKYMFPRDLERGVIDIFATRFAKSLCERLGVQTAEEMVADFNNRNSHIENGIECKDWIEISM